MYILSTCCISPQDTFENNNGLLLRASILNGNRWSCVEPDYKTCITDLSLRRRMSRVIKMSVAAALRCVDRSGTKPDAIITATGLGCLADTERFLDAIVENELQLNPTPFIQSTFNTAGAQIAFMLGNNGYNNTYVHRGLSFESALLDAKMQIDEGVSNVLAGCFDETTDVSFNVMSRLGFWKEGTAAGEGASFFMLGKQPPADKPEIQIAGLRFFNTDADCTSIAMQLNDCLASMPKSADGIDLLILGNNGDPEYDKSYRRFISSHYPDKPCCSFKNLCGEYFTASGFALYLAFCILTLQTIPEGVVCQGSIPPEINSILIYNHFKNINHSLIVVTRN